MTGAQLCTALPCLSSGGENILYVVNYKCTRQVSEKESSYFSIYIEIVTLCESGDRDPASNDASLPLFLVSTSTDEMILMIYYTR